MSKKQKSYETIQTNDGSWTVKNTRLNECYHSMYGATAEAQSLYIDKSNIASRLNENTVPVAVLDVGLGLGYNALATAQIWYDSHSQCDLYLTSLENDPLLLADFVSATASWQQKMPELQAKWLRAFQKSPSGYFTEIKHTNGKNKLVWNIIIGDALLLEKSKINPKVSFIWQDPFSPANNPRMWSSRWFSCLKEISSPHVVLLTYSVARSVKNALQDSGWQYEKITANSTKKHWLKANL